jgi:hypothetical protein
MGAFAPFYFPPMKSDRLLKDNIYPLEDIHTLLKLEPVQFKMKGSERIHFGLIAQDLEATSYKNLVYENRSGIKSIAYVELIAVLIKHVQELTDRVNALENP